MRTIFCILYITALAQIAPAQNPGYLGKHIQVFACLEPGISFARYNNTFSALEEYTGVPADLSNNYGLVLTPGFGIEGTVSKSLALGLNMHFFRVINPVYDLFYLPGENPDHLYIGETITKWNPLGFYLKFYPFKRKGVIAPVGQYHQFEVFTGKANVANGKYIVDDQESFEELVYYVYSSPTEFPVMTTDVSTLGYPDFRVTGLRYTFGNEMVIADKIPLELGGTFTWCLEKVDDNLFDYSQSGLLLPMVDEQLVKSLVVGLTLKVGYWVL